VGLVVTEPLETVLDGLAQAFDLDRGVLADASALRTAAATALRDRTPDQLVSDLLAEGPLTGAFNPYGAVIARTRRLCRRPSGAARALEADVAQRHQRLDGSFRHGDLLRRTVGLSYDEALEVLRADERYADPDMMQAARSGLANGPWQ
jgi:hypothetical protein